MSEHRRDLTAAEQAQWDREETAYLAWCAERDLDPESAASAVAYEGDVGWDLSEPEEDHL
jgi:hypothetical protein